MFKKVCAISTALYLMAMPLGMAHGGYHGMMGNGYYYGRQGHGPMFGNCAYRNYGYHNGYDRNYARYNGYNHNGYAEHYGYYGDNFYRN